MLQKNVTGEVKFENVSFSYPTRAEVPVLKDVTFTISSGQTLAIVGPSGGGKSTVTALIERFYDPTHGDVVRKTEYKQYVLHLDDLLIEIGWYQH